VTIRVLIADDQTVVRTGIRMLLDGEPDIEVVGEAADGKQAVALARQRSATVVLMDIRMPVMDGLEATRLLSGQGVGNPIDVLVLTTFDLDEYVFGALRAGAAGFLFKDAQPHVLVSALRTVAAGHGLVAPEVTRRLLGEFARTSPNEPATDMVAALSDREREVLLLVARGLTNAEIAKRLVIEETTVKTHVSSLLGKLGVRSRTQAVIYAYESGIAQRGYP
jgi:DNA-binding NarL/FixJ family response regulator